jgi:hypothetical protein
MIRISAGIYILWLTILAWACIGLIVGMALGLSTLAAICSYLALGALIFLILAPPVTPRAALHVATERSP